MNRDEAIAYLTQCADDNGAHWHGGTEYPEAWCPTCKGTNRAGHLGTPGSRYGRTSADCAPVAYAVALIYQDANGDDIDADLLSRIMSQVVNDSDGPEELIREHGDREALALLD